MSAPTTRVGRRPTATSTLRSKPARQGRRDQRIGGVAPTVRPPSRLARWSASRRLGRRGFVPLSPGREKRRHRILPRTVIGISSMLLAFAVGVGFSGATFYAYYDHRLARNEQEVARFVEGFDQQFVDASQALDVLRIEAIDEIRAELAPIGEYTSDARGVIGLPAAAGPSVWMVETRDQAGRPVAGSAFAVTGHEGGTALLTSLDVVRASTAQPGPGIVLVKGEQRLDAQLWTWDQENGLAVLVVQAAIPVLTLATPEAQAAALGARIFALSALGGQGATASPGVLIDQSASGLQHTAVVGTYFEGGPLLSGDGRVLGLATTTFHPFGIQGGAVSAAPGVDALCTSVLRCSDATTGGLTAAVGD
jgi:hypothetical protein